jgi:hypothetical protein
MLSSAWSRHVLLRPTSVLGAGLLGLGLAACGSNNGGTDAGPIGTDSPIGDLPALTVGTPTNPTAAPAVMGCLGTASAPAGGDPVDFEFQLRGFGSGDEVRMARVWFFPDNVVRETCDGDCQEFETDSMGNGMVTAPANGWYAYRVFERRGATMSATFVDSAQINEAAPASSGGSVEGNAVSVSTLNLIPAAYGFMRVPTTAIIAGEVQDCEGSPVRGAVLRLFRSDGTEIFNGAEASDPHIAYFDGMENPDNSSLFTQVDGLYATANISAPSTGFETIRVEGWGVPAEGGEVQRLGCEAVGIYENGVSIVNIGPLRNDYPAGHPCAE